MSRHGGAEGKPGRVGDLGDREQLEVSSDEPLVRVAREHRCVGSPAAELRLALLHEGGDTLLAILALEAAAERVGLAAKPFFE